MVKVVAVLFALGFIGVCLGLDESPTSPPVTVTVPTRAPSVPLTSPEVSVWASDVRGMSTTIAPVAQPASGPAGMGSGADEIDCSEAENLADSGEVEAGDLADYCDNGPDPGDVSDEVDWDE